MSLFDLKRNLLNEIAALRSLNTGFPELNLSSSFPSLDNNSNIIDFLLDLIKNLIGFEQLKEELIRFLTYQTNSIEATIKLILKNILKKYFSCSTDALIPDFMIDGLGDGFNVSVRQVDFFGLLKVDPNSIGGQLIYGNIEQDLNAFLYNVLQGNSGTWKSLLVVEYLPQGVVDGVVKTNVFNVKIDSSWSGRTVNDFINTFIDSVILFTLPSLINKIFDIIFGAISSLLGKSPSEVEGEVELELLVNKIVDLPDTVIDNSYFDFTPDEINYFNERVDERLNGRRILKDCNFVSSSINPNDLVDTNQQLSSAATLVEIQRVLDNQFTILANQATDNLDETSQEFGILNFFEQLFKGIIQGLANVVFAPKIMFLFVTYFKIVNNSVGFVNFKDFLQQNREFVIEIIREALLPLLTEFLLKLCIKYVTQLAIADQVGKFREITKNQQLQILSLTGVPQDVRNLIARLT
jgi:hypothetical protein